MITNYYSTKTMEEQIHTYLRVLDYIYESSKYNDMEDKDNEKKDSDICKTVIRQER